MIGMRSMIIVPKSDSMPDIMIQCEDEENWFGTLNVYAYSNKSTERLWIFQKSDTHGTQVKYLPVAYDLTHSPLMHGNGTYAQ